MYEGRESNLQAVSDLLRADTSDNLVISPHLLEILLCKTLHIGFFLLNPRQLERPSRDESRIYHKLFQVSMIKEFLVSIGSFIENTKSQIWSSTYTRIVAVRTSPAVGGSIENMQYEVFYMAEFL